MEIAIIGGGLAGLFTALKLAPMPVVIITPQKIGQGASSAWAQAGIAAAIGEGDSFEQHAADTIRAGAGLCDEEAVNSIVREAPYRIEDLLRYGVPFDRDLEGKLRQSREAAHSARRVVGVRGDQAGRAIMAALIAATHATPSIRLIEEASATELFVEDGALTGLSYSVSHTKGKVVPEFLPTRAVVLATGGIGQLFALTTNPREARGEGLAMAARAGAIIADAEFIQFHPTALDVGKQPAPLATEALRGEGATLVNLSGERFMLAVHPDAELAPRDIVARAVQIERSAGRGAFLDCRGKLGAGMEEHFPTVYAACRDAGISPATDLIPVAPAAHYHMGGVATDQKARSNCKGLWAVGEVASTGLHGANRLASNSLLEAVVMAARAAEDIASTAFVTSANNESPPPKLMGSVSIDNDQSSFTRLQNMMTDHAGVVRSEESLIGALHLIETLAEAAPASTPLAKALDAARFVAVSALQRHESRGGHYRADHPEAVAGSAHSYLSYKDSLTASAKFLEHTV